MTKPSNNVSSASTSMAMDGSDEDSALSKSEFLTRQEVLKRRSRRLKQLAKVYRDHYWSLMDELKLKYREYYWEYGKSPFQEDEDRENLDWKNSIQGTGEDANTNNNGNGSKLGLGLGVNANRCVVNGCKSKAMALTRFCHSHILSDAKQKLYKGCNYVTKSSPTGPIFCMKPILRSTVPSLCAFHLQKAEKHVTRALKKAGLNATSTSKLAPKFHVIVAEFVRQIQTKRRSAQKAIVVGGVDRQNPGLGNISDRMEKRRFGRDIDLCGERPNFVPLKLVEAGARWIDHHMWGGLYVIRENH